MAVYENSFVKNNRISDYFDIFFISNLNAVDLAVDSLQIQRGQLPEDLNEGISVEVLADGLYRNHGYWHDQDNGEPA